MAQKLPYDVFIKTFEHVPRVALNLIVTNEKNEVLLTKRAIPPSIGVWYFPGSYLLKTEKLTECLERIADDELGLKIDGSVPHLLGVFENLDTDPRGHVIDILYGYEVRNDQIFSDEGEKEKHQFFNKLPENMGFNHRETLNRLGFS